MTSYQLPVQGYRAQCLVVHTADRITLLVELRKGLYERVEVKLRGVVVPRLDANHWVSEIGRECPLMDPDQYPGKPCDCGADGERQRAGAALGWVEKTLRYWLADTGFWVQREVSLDHWPLRVELHREGSEWLADVYFQSDYDTTLDANVELNLTKQLISAGHARAVGSNEQ